MTTLRQAVIEINKRFDDAGTYERRSNKSRLAAGQMLLALRARIEAGEAGEGVSWWDWFETQTFTRSRRDAEKVMRIASQEDPDAAYEEEKNRRAEGMRVSRAAHVGRSEEIEEQPEEEDTLEEPENEVRSIYWRIQSLDASQQQQLRSMLKW